MYVHADRGASRATKTSVRATNVKHVDTREHTDEPRQRTHRERGGERAESAGLRSLSLSLLLSPSFFLPSMPRPFFSVPPSVLHAGCLGGSMYLFFYITGECERRKPVQAYTRTCAMPMHPYIRVYYAATLRSCFPSTFHSAFLSFLSIYLSSSPRICMHTDIALQVRRRTGRSAWFCTRPCREREREGEVPESAHFGSPCL